MSFHSEFDANQDSVRKFKLLDDLSSLKAVMGFYLFSIILAGVNAYLEILPTKIGSVDSVFVISIGLTLIYLLFTVRFINEMNAIGLSRPEVAYFYLSKSAGEVEKEDPDYQMVFQNLKKARDYVESNNVDIAHPRLQHLMFDYISDLEDLEEDSRRREMKISASTNISNFCSSIAEAEEIEFIEVENKPKPKHQLLIDSVFGGTTNVSSKKYIAVIVLISAVIAFVLKGAPWAAAVLTSYPVIEIIVPNSRGENQE